MKPKTDKPEIILDELQKVKSWFDQIKITTEGTRFEDILNNFINIVKYKQESSVNDYIKDYGFENYFYSALDALAFIDVYKGLSHYKGSLPKKKLKESLSGPLIPRNEILGDKNVNSRNTFFELEVASKLMLNDIQVIGFDDVNCNFENYRFFFECKRLLSKSNIESNINYAYTQLSRKLKNQNDRGIIALTFDKAYGFEGMLLDTSNFNDIEKKLNELGNIFIKENYPIWRSFNNKQIIGIILFIKFGTVYDKSKILKTEQTCVISLQSDIQINDKELLFRFSKVISKDLQPLYNKA